MDTKKITNIYNGQPSLSLSHRSFFSVIIPCYNSGATLGALLNSIVAQNMPDDIEVIVSDDHSPISYQNVIDQYKNLICIKQIQTDYNFAPGNTREKGTTIATGEWITFADHDDEYIPNTFMAIKNMILEKNERYYVINNFYEENPNTKQVIRKMIHTNNWCHGKFYNLDNLWKANDVHFKKDLLSHEDIYISSQINCAMRNMRRNPLYTDIYCYIWNSRPTTLSRVKYKEDHPFLEVFLNDYITSTGRVYLEKFQAGKLDREYALHSVAEVTLYCYFYMQGFRFHEPTSYDKTNEQYCRDYYIGIKKSFNVTNRDIWNMAAADDAKSYTTVREAAAIAAGPYIPTQTFAQWLDFMHEDINIPTVVMSDVMHKEGMPTVAPDSNSAMNVLDLVAASDKDKAAHNDSIS